MRLTKEMRETFADKVMDLIPMKSKWNQGKLEAEVTKRLNAAQPEAVKVFVRDYSQQANIVSVPINFMRYTRNGYSCFPHANTCYGVSLKDIKTDDLEGLWRQYRVELAERAATRAKIIDTSLAATTTQALALIFPKLAHLLPADVAVKKQLPVAASSLTDELVALGLKVK